MRAQELVHKVTENDNVVKDIIENVFNDQTEEAQVQFLLDCSTIPAVISSTQVHGPNILERLFYLTRNWCYTIHRSRMTELELFNFR